MAGRRGGVIFVIRESCIRAESTEMHQSSNQDKNERTTNNEQRTTNNEQRTTNNEQRITNPLNPHLTPFHQEGLQDVSEPFVDIGLYEIDAVLQAFEL